MAQNLYQLRVLSGSGSGSYAAGEAVPVSANPPRSGRTFANWIGSGVEYLDNTESSATVLRMPSKSVLLVPKYKEGENQEPIVNPAPVSNPDPVIAPQPVETPQPIQNVATGRQSIFLGSRRYILYVPNNYTSEQSYPLVISSHGTRQNGDTEMDSSGPNNSWDRGTPTWPTLAERHNVIVATPDYEGSFWESDSGRSTLFPGQREKLMSDEKFTLQLIISLADKYNIDPNRVWLTGFSGGGMLVHWLFLRNSFLFDAVSARHANFLTDLVPATNVEMEKATPIYIFAGSNDPWHESPAARAWYQGNGFSQLKYVIHSSGPSREHTTDREEALLWFLSL